MQAGAANYLVNVADKDGLTFAIVQRETIMDPLMLPAEVTVTLPAVLLIVPTLPTLPVLKNWMFPEPLLEAWKPGTTLAAFNSVMPPTAVASMLCASIAPDWVSVAALMVTDPPDAPLAEMAPLGVTIRPLTAI